LKLAADSNVLAYAEGVDDAYRQKRAIAVIDAAAGDLVIPAQSLGELFSVLTRKAGYSKADAGARIQVWCGGYTIIPTSLAALLDGAALAAAHDFQIWDAIILATAAEAGCQILLSEDMHDGFVWNGATIVNPFAKEIHPLLIAALER
jgi:predicted nucleic acid-binding protein